MDAEQHRNWVDFTTRMAKRVRPAMGPMRRARLASAATGLVKELPRALDHVAIVDWDGHPSPAEWFEDRLAHAGHGRPAELDEDGELALACIQAGFDVAVSPSDGVVGSDATLGLVRSMYPEGLPDFVRAHLASTGVVPETEPDGRRLWL